MSFCPLTSKTGKQKEKASEMIAIYKARVEEIVTAKDGKPTVRIARFLKPCARRTEQAPQLPTVPLLSENFSQNGKGWPLTVAFRGFQRPQNEWLDWVDRLAGKYGAIWLQSNICDAILTSTYQILENNDLILGLAEFWCPETNTFLFPWGEATITLEDVMVNGGFSAIGEPVSSPVTGELVKIVEAMDRNRVELYRSKSKKPSHGAWLTQCMKEESEFEHVEFLSLWLSRFVFPSRPKDNVRKQVFPIAVHLSQGKKLALGPAVLASLYRNLTLLKEQAVASVKSISISGPLQLLQLWAFERFSLRERKSPNPLQPGEPRAARWHKLKSKIDLPSVRSVLNSAVNFCWRPYAVNVNNWRHLSYYQDKAQVLINNLSSDEEIESFSRCLKASELVGLDGEKEKYLPFRVARQFGYDQDIPGDFPGLDFANKMLRIFIPSRSYEPAMSARYVIWWSRSMSAREEVVKGILRLERSSRDTALPPTSEMEKDNCDLKAPSVSQREKISHGSIKAKSPGTSDEGSNNPEVSETLEETENAANAAQKVGNKSAMSSENLTSSGDKSLELLSTHDSSSKNIPRATEDLSDDDYNVDLPISACLIAKKVARRPENDTSNPSKSTASAAEADAGNQRGNVAKPQIISGGEKAKVKTEAGSGNTKGDEAIGMKRKAGDFDNPIVIGDWIGCSKWGRGSKGPIFIDLRDEEETAALGSKDFRHPAVIDLTTCEKLGLQDEDGSFNE